MPRQLFNSFASGEGIIHNWEHLSPGDAVYVTHPAMGRFFAVIDEMTEDSSAVWILQDGFGSRHLFLNRDGIAIFRQP